MSVGFADGSISFISEYLLPFLISGKDITDVNWWTGVAGGLLVSRLVLYSVKRYLKADPYLAKTKEQTNWKGTKGIVKINFPIFKMLHTY